MVSPITGTAANPVLKALSYGAPLQILVTAPSSYPDNNTVPPSVMPTWRSAAWHATTGQAFANNAGITEINNTFWAKHNAAEILKYRTEQRSIPE